MSRRASSRHEALTMALYVSLSLLAVLAAMPSEAIAVTAFGAAATIALASLGLLLAHALAFRLSARFVHQGQLPLGYRDLVAAQLAGGLAVTVVAVTPVVVVGGQAGVRLSAYVLLAFVAAVAYAAARMIPVSRPTALAAVGVSGLVVLGILAIKGLAGH